MRAVTSVVFRFNRKLFVPYKKPRACYYIKLLLYTNINIYYTLRAFVCACVHARAVCGCEMKKFDWHGAKQLVIFLTFNLF